MWSTRLMAHRSRDRAAIGPVNLSTTCTATSSVGAGVRSPSARKPRRTTLHDQNPVGGEPAGFSFAAHGDVGASSTDSVLRRFFLHVIEHGRRGPAVDLDPI